ncbi:MAG: glycosyltransferase [Bacteroidaceae bacterium]|nr:glycosyltransferase [Bacteroidaceae bacterium]
MEKTKILMVMGSTGMAGTQMFVLNLVENMDRTKFQVDFAVDRGDDGTGIGKRLKDLGCNIYFLPYFKVYNYFGYVKAWRQFLREHHYDIVHGHSSNSAVIYLKIAKEMGCATIAHSHNAGYRGGFLPRLFKSLFAKGAGKVSDYWFACSDIAAQRLYGDAYKSYPHYYNIPNAINMDAFCFNSETRQRVRALLKVDDDELLCGHVGTLMPQKNHDFLMEIMAEVVKIVPKARLVCCGAGPLMDKVKEKARLLGIEDHVIFAGVVKANEYMMAMDVMVFPSFNEGFPVTIIEAEATGLPVVMSDTITTEIDLTNLVHRHSLNDQASKWAKTICSLKYDDRQSYNKVLTDTKYNVRSGAQFVSSLYDKMIRKH